MKLPRQSDVPLEDPEQEHPTPEYWWDDEEVEAAEPDYSDRSQDDWIVSGPLGSAKWPGRRFDSWAAAEKWARGFYGSRLRSRVAELYFEESTRWAFWVRGRK